MAELIKEDLEAQFDQKLWPSLTNIAEDFHKAVLGKLQSEEEENAVGESENSLALLQQPSSKKSDQPQNHVAIETQEVNSVELAFAKRPHSPENFKIHQDRDVNGPKKCVDFVHHKYKH